MAGWDLKRLHKLGPCDINGEGAAATAARIANQTGRRAIGVAVDVTDEAQVEGMFAAAVEHFGGVDVVVANAAILIAEPIAEADAAKWRRVMEVNLFGYFLG